MQLRSYSTPRVAIAGGGPAGAIVAMTLARQGLRPVVFEAAPEPQAKVGECLPPASLPLLNRLGLTAHILEGPHLPSYGNRSCWGSDHPLERDFLFGIYGAGWHLNRRCFEEVLARVAMESGAEWHYASRITSVRWHNGHWECTVEKSGAKHDNGADFLVDATGRRASLARRLGAHRVSYDKLVGLASQLKPTNGSGMTDTFTLVEAVPSGWWYSALLSDGELVMAYLTDHDLPEFRLARQFEGWWEMLSQTRYSWSRVQEHGYQPYLPLRILPASSVRLTSIFGQRWLAVGDAAAAYDPLSSHGITTAMGCGFYAAQAITNLLDGQAEAHFAYLSLLEKTYAIYLEQQRECYASEQRWPWHPFWSRRHTKAGS